MDDDSDDSSDPFHAFRVENAKPKMTSAGKRRVAFRQNSAGIINTGAEGECQIARHPKGVKKFGTRVKREEARAMQFAHSLQLPVPAVHEISESGTQTSILMDFVDGECLEEVWPTMNVGEKQSIAEQVRDIVTAMRKAAPSQTSIGAFDGPARDCRQFLDYQGGPFEDIATFNEFVLDFLDGTPPYIRESVAEALNSIASNRIVLSHCDLTPRNIIVQDGRITALLDWEYAGWYPEYWEFVKFFDRPTGCKDWKSFAGTMFEAPYSKELLVFQALARWQRP